MDSNLLELFTIEEVLGRLGRKEGTGSLHVFTPREAANVVFKEGKIVGAAKGLVEGEEVVKQILDWKDARAIWQPGSAGTAVNSKPVEIEVSDFLFKLKMAPKIAIGGKLLPETLPSKSAQIEVPAPQLVPVPRVVTNGAEHKNSTAEPHPEGEKTMLVTTTPPLTATKNIHSGAPARTAHEESLLRRHQLALVSLDEGPKQRVGIRQMSVLVGRNPACDLMLDHGSVSRQHCLLQITERGLHVKDLGTTNGTKVNGIVLTEGYINVGDKLTIGKLTYLLDKEVEPEEEAAA